MIRSRLPGLLLGTAGIVLVADRSTKWLVGSTLAGRSPLQVIPNVLRFRYTTNTGGAFGILSNAPWVFAIATLGVSIAIVMNVRKVRTPLVAIGLGLILGGAIGNLVDRLGGGLRLDGTVTDFIDVHIWPVFNIADCGVVVGAALLALSTLRRSERPEPTAEEASDAGD